MQLPKTDISDLVKESFVDMSKLTLLKTLLRMLLLMRLVRLHIQFEISF